MSTKDYVMCILFLYSFCANNESSKNTWIECDNELNLNECSCIDVLQLNMAFLMAHLFDSHSKKDILWKRSDIIIPDTQFKCDDLIGLGYNMCFFEKEDCREINTSIMGLNSCNYNSNIINCSILDYKTFYSYIKDKLFIFDEKVCNIIAATSISKHCICNYKREKMSTIVFLFFPWLLNDYIKYWYDSSSKDKNVCIEILKQLSDYINMFKIFCENSAEINLIREVTSDIISSISMENKLIFKYGSNKYKKMNSELVKRFNKKFVNSKDFIQNSLFIKSDNINPSIADGIREQINKILKKLLEDEIEQEDDKNRIKYYVKTLEVLFDSHSDNQVHKEFFEHRIRICGKRKISNIKNLFLRKN